MHTMRRAAAETEFGGEAACESRGDRSSPPGAERGAVRGAGRNRRHRLRQHQQHLPGRGAVVPAPRDRGVADRDAAAAAARGAEFGVPAVAVEDLLADPAIEIVVNLTVPGAHVEVSRQIVAAGKHVYSEKPLGVAFAEAGTLMAEAARRGVRIGCAPDTFLGGGHQTARAVLDAGRLGEPVGGTAFFMCPGHERWHPNPDFYYKAGGGPMLDMGPYYITDLVNLLGPVARVAGMAPKPRPIRTITSQPRAGAEHRRRGADPRRRQPRVRRRRGGRDHHELRRARPPPPADRGLRHRGEPARAGSRTGSAARSRSCRRAASGRRCR